MTSSRGENRDAPQEGEPPAPPLPPDGGWGWVVVIGSLVCNIIVDGICFSFGIFLLPLIAEFGESRGKTAFVGSLIPGLYLGVGPIASALANKYGIRAVTVAGSIIASLAFFLSTFTTTLNQLIVVYGVIGGIGFGLMYLPAIVIVNFYFVKKRALATGIAVCGSGIGTFLFSAVAPPMLRAFGWQGSYWIMSGLILNGIVCALVFRPLKAEKPKPPRPALSVDDFPIKRGIIMDKIIEEKKRQRTYSEHTLDGAIITQNNEIVKDKNLLKKVLLKPLAEETLNASTELDKNPMTDTSPGVSENPAPNGDVVTDIDVGADGPLRKISAPVGPTTGLNLRNKHLDRVRGVNPMGSGPMLISSSTSLGGRRKRTTSNASELWRRENFGSRSNLEKEEFKREISRPMYRQDIFYTGSVTSLAQYQSNRSLKSFIDSQTSIPEPEPEEIGTCHEKCLPFIHIVQEMLDFSLLKSPTFIPLLITAFLALFGFFIPFVYLVDYGISLGMDPSQSSVLLQIIGISNTVGRILTGMVCDKPWADTLLIHNLALIVAGLATCCIPLLKSWILLQAYCAVFGGCIAAYITLRTVVLAELLGIQKLSSSFGIQLLFQGIASLCGAPLSGAIYDLTHDFTISFLIAGLTIFFAGAISLPVRRIKAWEEARDGANLDAEGFPPAPSLPNVNGDVIGAGTESELLSASKKSNANSKTTGGSSPGVKFGGNSYSKLDDQETEDLPEEGNELPEEIIEEEGEEEDEEVNLATEEEDTDAEEKEPLTSL